MSNVIRPELLLMLQLANALFIGILAGLGMVYFQDLMPGSPGQATTLFTNSIRTGSATSQASFISDIILFV
jgi:SET family sugar efflux transporter-like MFS transporter